MNNGRHFFYWCELCTLRYQHDRQAATAAAQAAEQAAQAAEQEAAAAGSSQPVIPPVETGMANFFQPPFSAPAASSIGSSASNTWQHFPSGPSGTTSGPRHQVAVCLAQLASGQAPSGSISGRWPIGLDGIPIRPLGTDGIPIEAPMPSRPAPQ